MRLPVLISIMSSVLLATPAFSQKDCGAAGDGCEPVLYQKFMAIAAQSFPDWPEVAYRTYASACYDSTDSHVRELCTKDPKKAAEVLNLLPD
ncbi:hypothetical protein [Bartonella choladocola]|uniref:Uncharacterized protein n=1 Tax=Bartonella choladocola TaxID=2750995 RepID=A0A1U9MJ91_9HYPH|nr:hypothetical protein [Bartonella choladocola]AQT47974.1 hypothetical protein BBC0122_018790 [Bartonella choladocola]